MIAYWKFLDFNWLTGFVPCSLVKYDFIAAQWSVFLLHIQDISASSLGLEINYSRQDFSWFFFGPSTHMPPEYLKLGFLPIHIHESSCQSTAQDLTAFWNKLQTDTTCRLAMSVLTWHIFSLRGQLTTVDCSCLKLLVRKVNEQLPIAAAIQACCERTGSSVHKTSLISWLFSAKWCLLKLIWNYPQASEQPLF
jgi:hypothetical protein